MYTKEQEEIALKEYERRGSVAAVIQRLGYPSESTLYRWYEQKKAGLENRHDQIAETTATTGHLPEGCHPVVHSDRGCHYRWPGSSVMAALWFIPNARVFISGVMTCALFCIVFAAKTVPGNIDKTRHHISSILHHRLMLFIFAFPPFPLHMYHMC